MMNILQNDCFFKQKRVRSDRFFDKPKLSDPLNMDSTLVQRVSVSIAVRRSGSGKWCHSKANGAILYILYILYKWCHSIYLNDRQFVTYKLFSLGIFA